MTLYEEEYWSERYSIGQTQWDIGEISTPIKEYLDQLSDKSIRILIPGCGNAHEAIYLFNKGFKNTTIVDIAAIPIERFNEQNPDFGNKNIVLGDFFDLKGKYDLILEQTFFCALDPGKRDRYASKMNDLLSDDGKLVGLLFDFNFDSNHPPFGGAKKDYENIFSKYFKLETLERCYNSIQPRKDKELFFKFMKKKTEII